MTENPARTGGSGRMRRRRKRRYGRLIKPVRYAAALAAVLIGIGMFFKISNIQVEGNVIYSDEEVSDAAGLIEGKSLFFAERKAAEKRIYSALPYIEDAAVIIKAPDTIIINVTESSAVASVPYDGEYITINRSCKVLEISPQTGNLIVKGLQPLAPAVGEKLAVEKNDSAKLSYLAQLLTLLEEKDMISEVTDMDISNMTDITFRYQNRLNVRMSGYDKVEYKLEFLSGIIEKIGTDAKGTVNFTTDKEGHYIPE